MFHKRMSLSFSSLLGAMLMQARCYAYDPEDADTKAALAEAVDAAVERLTNKNRELLAELRKAKSGKESDNSAEMERLETENARLSTELAKASKDLKAAQKAAEENGSTLASERAYTERLLIDNGLSAALTANGVTNPAHAKAAAALIRSTSKIEIAVDGDNRTATVGGKALADFVKEWSSTDDGKNFVTATANGGGGAPGSQQQQHKQAGNFGGTRDERIAAINARFGDKLASQ